LNEIVQGIDSGSEAEIVFKRGKQEYKTKIVVN